MKEQCSAIRKKDIQSWAAWFPNSKCRGRNKKAWERRHAGVTVHYIYDSVVYKCSPGVSFMTKVSNLLTTRSVSWWFTIESFPRNFCLLAHPRSRPNPKDSLHPVTDWYWVQRQGLFASFRTTTKDLSSSWRLWGWLRSLYNWITV
jgi:hypothetical protein